MIDPKDMEAIKQLVQKELTNSSRNDVEDEKSSRYAISRLGFNADNTAIINKINEIINELNKTLIDNRI